MSEASATLGAYARERERLIEEAEPSLVAAQALSKATDEAVAALAAAASGALSRPVAVLALGGYGAGRLLPASDIDLLVVTDGRSAELEAFSRELFYPLWDLGLDVGHQVRSRREHLRAVRDDITILTATLTGRVVAGDAELGERLLGETLAWARKRSDHVVAEIVARERPGSPYLLEPDLKEGAGGQRDLDELTWLAAILSGAPARTPSPLVELGLLSDADLSFLSSAQETLAAARWRLQVAADAHADTMTLNTAAGASVVAEAVQHALADVHHTLLAARARFSVRPLDDAPWNAARLFSTLGCGDEALDDLERAAWAGLLESVVPGIRKMMTFRRPGLSHRFTVGAHSLRAALAVSQVDGDKFAQRALEALPDRKPLQLAALVHDFGKETPGHGHAERGAARAERIASDIGLSGPLAWGVATLVREHLLLSDTATRQDLTDEDVILRAAARLGDRSLVGPLYLLTRADMLATGPEAWSPWRAALVRELTAKLDAALSDDVDGAGIIAAADRVRTKALKRAASVGMERSALAFVEEAPLRYLATRDPDEVLRHARLVRELRGPLGHGGVVMDVTTGAASKSWRVTVVTRDREGIFARIAGVLSLADLDILGAEAFTETSGVVLDVFTVTGASKAEVGHDRWARVERLLRAAVADDLDVEARLIERRRHYPARAAGEVEVRTDSGGPLATIIRVEAPDRVGLLHDLAAALHEHGLDIRLVRAESHDGRIRDVFHVVDEQGFPPRDAATLATIAGDLESAAGR